MRAILLALCLALCAAAAAADPRPAAAIQRPQCRHLDGQIDHYQTLRARADALGSPLWESRIDSHLKRLEQHRVRSGCPSRNPAAEIAKQLRALLKLAAEGALTFFTMGAM